MHIPQIIVRTDFDEAAKIGGRQLVLLVGFLRNQEFPEWWIGEWGDRMPFSDPADPNEKLPIGGWHVQHDQGGGTECAYSTRDPHRDQIYQPTVVAWAELPPAEIPGATGP